MKTQGRLSEMAREVILVMGWASKVLERVPLDRRSVLGEMKDIGTVEKSVVSVIEHPPVSFVT